MTSILDVPEHLLTPGMRQYRDAKREHPDCVIMLRMGDFYEMFYEDALLAAKELEITLTKRGKGEKTAPLAGVPYHALEPYLGKFIKKGYKVAIVEQLEDPKLAKGLVKRGVVRVVTPGTVIESSLLSEADNNYVGAIRTNAHEQSFAFCDLSTGEFLCGKTDTLTELLSHMTKHNVTECLVPESLLVNHEFIKELRNQKIFVTSFDDFHFRYESANQVLMNHFNVADISSFGIADKTIIGVCGALIHYLHETQKTHLAHIKKIQQLHSQEHMHLDKSTLRNLELMHNIIDRSTKGTLLSILDHTTTSLGARLLKRVMTLPLLSQEKIEERLQGVDELRNQTIARQEITQILSSIYDIERLIGRVNFGNATPRDLLALSKTLQQLPVLKEKLGMFSSTLLKTIGSFDTLEQTYHLLHSSINEEAPITVREGGIIKQGFNQELDELLDIKHNSKKYLAEIERKEKEKTGITSLRISFNRVFGYFIEITKRFSDKVPEHYIRKQTTANSERYITEELKIEEEKILGAQEKITALEYNLFIQINNEVKKKTREIQKIAASIALLDVLCSFSIVSLKNNYCRPKFNSLEKIEIIDGRHPVVETIENKFVPNTVLLGNGEFMVITGPNTSGKCLVGESIIFSEFGMIPIKNFKPEKLVPEKFSPLKVKICGRYGPEPTSHFYYDGKKTTIKLTTRFGYEIEGTPNHPILVRTKEGMEIWRKLGEIKKEDYIIINRKLGLWGTKTKIPKETLVKATSYNYNNKVIKYKLPKVLDAELAYIIGLLIGDGTLTYKNDIALSNIDTQIIRDFSRIVKKKFGCITKTKKNKADHVICSKQIRLFFEGLGLGYENSLNKKVPHSILQSPKKIIRAFLRGLFDTDGDVTKYGDCSLSTSSLKMAKQVHLLLLNFGIISSMKKKKTNRNMNYRVSIYGENAILFHKEIGFKLQRKRERKKLCSTIRRPNYGIPHLNDLLKDVQKKIVNKQNKKIALKKVKKINSIFYTYIPNKKNISYHKLKELIDYCKLNEINCEELKKIYSNYHFYDFIERIEKSKKLKDVYDFSIPKTHSFTANGLINHNSTVMRQTALICLMAQIGSYVPAEHANLSVVDRIFTRVGAHDDLSSGQSTFMVEMLETAHILQTATNKSLLILDEIGRGTSTFDGVAIAWSTAEHIYNSIGAKTMFATHYHVLNKLANKFERIKNYNVAVKEVEGDIIFLRKLIEGGTDQSHGVHVAKLAGMPASVVMRASELQEALEAEDTMIKKIKEKRVDGQKGLGEF